MQRPSQRAGRGGGQLVSRGVDVLSDSRSIIRPIPGPSFAGRDGAAEGPYYTWVDQHDILGLGANVPLGTGNFSDSLHALTYGKVVELRVPYPMGFFAKGIDGRVDDPGAG